MRFVRQGAYTKYLQYRHVSKRGSGRSERPPVFEHRRRADRVMPATLDTRVARLESDAPKAAQTTFNARDTLAGRFHDTTVRQAVQGEL